MKRKIAALALGFVVVLAGACASKTDDASTTTASVEDPGPTETPQEMQLVDVPVSKPAPGVKVDAATLPPEMSNFTAIPGVTPDQQNCVNGAIKGAVASDATLSKTPGKVASVGGKAVAVCDTGAIFTDPLVDGLAAAGADAKVTITPAQSTCIKAAFASDKENSAKVIGASMTMNPAAIKKALEAFDAKCGVKISDALGAS